MTPRIMDRRRGFRLELTQNERRPVRLRFGDGEQVLAQIMNLSFGGLGLCLTEGKTVPCREPLVVWSPCGLGGREFQGEIAYCRIESSGPYLGLRFLADCSFFNLGNLASGCRQQ